MISGWREYALDNLLTKEQKETFNKLPIGKVKSSINVLISSHGLGNSIETIRIALNILKNTSHSPERELFICCLLDSAKISGLPVLQKVDRIAKEGFFDVLLRNVEVKTKEYHLPTTLTSMIEQFEQQVFPHLIQEKKNKMLGDLEAIPSHSHSAETYHALQDNSDYYRLPKEISKFIRSQPYENKIIQGLFTHLFYTLDLQYSRTFTDEERLHLSQLVLRILNPTTQTLASSYSLVDVDELIRQAVQLREEIGEEALGYFFHSLKKEEKECRLDEITRGLTLINMASKRGDFFNLLKTWKSDGYSWNQLSILIEKHFVENGLDPTLFQEDITLRLQRFKIDPNVSCPLSDKEITRIKQQYERINHLCFDRQRYSFVRLIQEAHTIREKAMKGSIEEEEMLILIANCRLAIRIHFGIYPYSTQILALLGVLGGTESIQAQVKTGEGKSTINALWAFVKAMECKSVDIITSARYLAIRDQKKFASFFNRCGISTSHICYDKKQSSNFMAQILYGPAFDFEFAWMEDRFLGTHLYQARLNVPYVKQNFDCVCVDEADNLLIDGMSNSCRLGFPAEVSYDWVYSPLFLFIRWICTVKDEDVPEEEKYLIEFRDFINEKREDLNDQLLNNSNNVMDLLLLLFNQTNKKEAVDLTIARAKRYLIQHTSQEYHARIEEIADTKISRWLFSAYHAQYKLDDKIHYVVREKRNNEGNLQPSVQIVDLKTGRISENSRWQNGIHEFLEVKHYIPVQKESLTPISLSHPVFYGFYHTITALTGTAERIQTERIFGIKSFDIPPHLPLQRVDLPIEILIDEESYFDRIFEVIQTMIGSMRPQLILCANIKETLEFGRRLKEAKLPFQLLNEVQEELEHIIIEQAGMAGKITIATNTAGRGTDIILSQESLKNGGLSTLLTFYPESGRVEDQAIGRSGRQGQPGSSQIIIHRERPEIVQVLVDKAKKSYSDQELINLLNTHRQEEEKFQAVQNCNRAELERFTAELTNPFYENLRAWSETVQTEEFLVMHSERLNTLKLNSNKEYPVDLLPVSDRLIALECIKILKTKETLSMSWKALLRNVIERIKEKTISAWCLNFYHEIEPLLSNDGDLNVNRKKISLLYETHQDKWTKYLQANGSGIFVYLKEITTINIPAGQKV